MTSPPMDPWAPDVRAADVPVVDGGGPSPFSDLADEPASDIDTHKVTVTFFTDEAAASLRRVELTLPQLAAHIGYQTAASKMELPWLKLAIFGNQRSEKNCLRTNANTLQISGTENEHDAGDMSFDDAIAIIRKAGIRALLYTSPSYVPATKERWRVLVPLSKNHQPEAREGLVARVNGLLSGKLAPESFVLSQAYLYGSVNNNPDHRVEVIDGDFLDLRDDTYAGSIFKDGSKVGDQGAGHDFNGAGPQHRSRANDDPEPVNPSKIEAALDVVSSDCSYKVWLDVAAGLYHELGEHGFPLFDRWSAKATGTVAENGKPEPRYTPAKSRERWRGARTMRSVTIATLFHYADQADPAWRQRYNDEERQRAFARMAAGAGASSGAGTSGAGAGTGSTSSGTAGTGQTPPPLIQAKPFALRDPKTLPRRQWVYGRHLIRKFGSATFAPSGSGKTNTFIVEALAIATGRDLLGITPPKRARVWLWNGEDPYDELERRVGAACLHYKITPEEINGWLFINSGRDSDSRIVIATQSRNGVTIAVPMVEALIQTIRDNKIDVVMIDPFISSHNVTENDNNAIDTVAKTWTGIADVTNIALDLGHHTRKTGGAEVSVEDGRGAVALLNAVRPARVLNVMTEDEAAKAGVTDGRKRYFRVTDGKNNLALPADKMEWFRSTTINLGNGDDPGNLLDRGDDIGVITKWEWPDPLDGVTGKDFEKAAVAIRAGKWRKDAQCKDWVGHAVAKALKLGDVSRKGRDKTKVTGLIRIWLASGALIEVEGQDDRRRARIFIEVAEED